MKASRLKSLAFSSICSASFAASLTFAADWPQYRGPSHNGVSAEKIAKWPDAGPRQVWKVPMNAGFSSIAVADGIAATLVSREKDGVAVETLLALDANNGNEVWAGPLSVAK